MDRGSQQIITVGTMALTPLLPASQQRRRLHFSVASGTAYVTDRPDATAGTGFPVTPGSPLIMDRDNYGDMLHHSWFGSSLSGVVDIGVIDVQDVGPNEV